MVIIFHSPRPHTRIHANKYICQSINILLLGCYYYFSNSLRNTLFFLFIYLFFNHSTIFLQTHSSLVSRHSTNIYLMYYIPGAMLGSEKGAELRTPCHIQGVTTFMGDKCAHTYLDLLIGHPEGNNRNSLLTSSLGTKFFCESIPRLSRHLE